MSGNGWDSTTARSVAPRPPTDGPPAQLVDPPVLQSRMRGRPSALHMSSIASSSARPCPAAAQSQPQKRPLGNRIIASSNAAAALTELGTPPPTMTPPPSTLAPTPPHRHSTTPHPCSCAPPASRRRGPPSNWGPRAPWRRRSACGAPEFRGCGGWGHGGWGGMGGVRGGGRESHQETVEDGGWRSDGQRLVMHPTWGQPPERALPAGGQVRRAQRQRPAQRTESIGTAGLGAPSRRPSFISGGVSWAMSAAGVSAGGGGGHCDLNRGSSTTTLKPPKSCGRSGRAGIEDRQMRGHAGVRAGGGWAR